jgi:hypothetical protein
MAELRLRTFKIWLPQFCNSLNLLPVPLLSSPFSSAQGGFKNQPKTCLKGTVARDLLPPIFFHKSTGFQGQKYAENCGIEASSYGLKVYQMHGIITHAGQQGSTPCVSFFSLSIGQMLPRTVIWYHSMKTTLPLKDPRNSLQQRSKLCSDFADFDQRFSFFSDFLLLSICLARTVKKLWKKCEFRCRTLINCIVRQWSKFFPCVMGAHIRLQYIVKLAFKSFEKVKKGNVRKI